MWYLPLCLFDCLLWGEPATMSGTFSAALWGGQVERNWGLLPTAKQLALWVSYFGHLCSSPGQAFRWLQPTDANLSTANPGEILCHNHQLNCSWVPDQRDLWDRRSVLFQDVKCHCNWLRDKRLINTEGRKAAQAATPLAWPHPLSLFPC